MWFSVTAKDGEGAEVPFVAEGTTFNIHGGRDMFAKTKPPIAKKPSLERLARTRSFHRQCSATESVESRFDVINKSYNHRLNIAH